MALMPCQEWERKSYSYIIDVGNAQIYKHHDYIES